MLSGDPSTRDVFEIVAAWLDWLAMQAFAVTTIRNYGDALLRAGRIARKDPRIFTEADVIGVLSSYGPNPRGPARGTMLRALKSFYSWATDVEVNEVMLDPTRRLKVPREKLQRAPTLSPEDLSRVLRAAERVDPRARPTLTLAYYTGARAGSLVALRPEDLKKMADGSVLVHFREAKGGRAYDVPVVAPEAQEAISELLRLKDFAPLRGRRRDTLIGVGRTRLEDWTREAGRLAGVGRVYPHLFRHTFATELDTDDRTFAELMNHRDASQRRRYARPKDERMLAAVAGLERQG
jgi:integrase